MSSKTIYRVRVVSRMDTLDQRPLGAHSWYQDKKSKEFGQLVEVDLKKVGGDWVANVRETSGPVMAGGGWKGIVRKKYGYWYTFNTESWDE